MQDPAAIKKDILARAQAEGFSTVRFTKAQAEPANADRLREFLDAGHHGSMGWMAERAQPRSRSASFRVWGPHTSSGAVRGNRR